MAEIHVIFPEQGGVAINSNCKSVLKGEYVNWHIYCQVPGIKKVRLRFDSAHATFFPTGGNGNPTREVTKDVEDGSTIWGRAPHYRSNFRRDKYSIQGLGLNGEVIAELDPEIITHDPKNG